MKQVEILKRAYHLIKEQENQKQSPRWEFKPQEPDPNVNYEFKKFKIPKSDSRKQKAARDCQAKLLAFWELKKKVTTQNETIIYIPTTSKRLKQIFGNSMAISRAIDVMIDCGLIAEYNEKFSFNHKFNYCKQYVFNKPKWSAFVSYCTENQILAYKSKQIREYVIRDTIANTFDMAFTAARFEFTSKGTFYKPHDMSNDQFELCGYAFLKENYGRCLFYDLADYINSTYYSDDPDLQIQYLPTFTWNAARTRINKVGIRATNSIVSAKKEKEDDDPDYILYKDDVKSKYGVFFEYDVKSSIPKITILLNKGKWLPQNVDCYKLIWDEICKLLPEFAETEWNAETRDMIKYFFMRAYFDTYAMIAAHTKRAISLKGNYKSEEWTDLDQIMKVYKLAVENALGRLYDNEVFLHESNIYMLVTKSLLEDGYKVVQIYDNWITDKEVTDIEERVKTAAIHYYNEYYKEYNERRNERIKEETKITIEEYKEIIERKKDNRDTIANTFANKEKDKQKTTNLVDEAMKNDECEQNECNRIQPNEKTKRKKRIIVIKKNF